MHDEWNGHAGRPATSSAQACQAASQSASQLPQRIIHSDTALSGEGLGWTRLIAWPDP